MKASSTKTFVLSLMVFAVVLALTVAPATAADKKPNIMFIMADDIGFMQPSIYHRGLMVGETPNIDRLGKEGGVFMDYYAMQSCTSGRAAFVTGMYPLRVGLSVPMMPGMPAWLRQGKVLDEVKGTGGKILKTSLSHDNEAKLQAALNAAKN
jgi:hypothetical protein